MFLGFSGVRVIDHPADLARVFPDISEFSVVFVSLPLITIDPSTLTIIAASGITSQEIPETASRR